MVDVVVEENSLGYWCCMLAKVDRSNDYGVVS
jgi:hypothetical protein